ncbi:MarR family winged helix-turn-helix transcriptional regulator [Kineococcus rhizosphaerae]|uniref:MarR family transcriptional regulator n=1 Tax=Kineococcus rhizosphaerae TaxID=559628 RepID=A0A2T0R6Y2_9ACTN|nr:MarR family winged helix-turn-helix transcriptional regulator [Kineococcus rhizosphaerae]PRY16927.1 MarR family transcriptional regulator [Kineococcus rhizosphaerae]
MQLDELAERLLLSCSVLTRSATAAAPGTSLSLTQARVLGNLDRLGPQRISRLAELERCAQPSMTSLVTRLGDAGHVRRTADPLDARAVLVELTATGRAALVADRQRLCAPVARTLHDLPVDTGDLERLTGLLEEITHHLETGRTTRVATL